MKRAITMIMILTLALSCFSGCVFLGKADAKTTVGKWVELDLKDASVQTDQDTHGGFHGDGVWFVKLECSAHPLADDIAGNEHWKPLPASENVSTLLYGSSGWSPIVKIDDYDSGVYDEPLFPEVKDGWYYFYDRHDSAKDRYSEANVLSRYSYNFIVAVYDSDTDTLYFCKLDT